MLRDILEGHETGFAFLALDSEGGVVGMARGDEDGQIDQGPRWSLRSLGQQSQIDHRHVPIRRCASRERQEGRA